jgi:CheY-like chemotaxis protein
MPTERAWQVLVVEDNDQARADIVEHFTNYELAGRRLNIEEVSEFDVAIERVRQKSVDLIILDVFFGITLNSASPDGLKVLAALRESGFVCTVLYTAHPERVESEASAFVRLVGKDVNSLDLLTKVIVELFELRIPHIYRALVSHVDDTLRRYMWEFVDKNWSDLRDIAGTPEFLRLVLLRLGATLSAEGVDKIAVSVFGNASGAVSASGKVHPAEFYILPPLTPENPQVGDIRVESSEGQQSFIIVLWPSCDMVNSPTQAAKVKEILCAVPVRFDSEEIVKKWRANPSETKKKEMLRLMSNSHDKFHFLPGFCGVPDLIVDFRQLRVFDLALVRDMKCIATLASPYAESLASRFVRYLGRLGTPDLDHELVIKGLERTLSVEPSGGTGQP